MTELPSTESAAEVATEGAPAATRRPTGYESRQTERRRGSGEGVSVSRAPLWGRG